MPKRVDEVAQVEVGRFYMVPHLIRTSEKLQVWLPPDLNHYCGKPIPILPSAHADPDLGLEDFHIHYDWRFLDLGKNGIVNHAQVLGLDQIEDLKDDLYRQILISQGRGDLPIKWLKRKCRRLVTVPDSLCKKLEPNHKAAKLSSELHCPHKGICLKGHPMDEHGHVICPAHGLKWDIFTREMVSRIS